MNKNFTILILLAVAAFLFLGTSNTGSIAANNGGSGAAAGLLTCPSIVSQVTVPKGYDFDKPNTATAAATIVVFNPDGSIYPGGNATTQLGTYNFLVKLANYESVYLQNYKTSCDATGGSPSVLLKQYETSITSAVYNPDGITVNNAAHNISFAASGTATAHVKLSQTTTYKHLSGINNQFVVYANTTNMSDWAPSSWSMTFDGTPCTTYSGVQPNAIAVGAVDGAWLCTGDFAANDGTLHALDVKLMASAGKSGTAIQAVTLNIAPMELYQDTITGHVATGAVKNDGSALQPFQAVSIIVQ